MPIQTKRRRDAGFTLTEIMVAVFIIGLLSTVVLINVLGARTQAQTTKARGDIAALSQALDRYSLQMFDYPTEAQGLQALSDRPDGLRDPSLYPRGGFVQNVPVDPWGNPYQYIVPGERSGGAFDLFSLGADGQEGGEEENADIGNWE